MPVVKIPIVHKFGIISHSQRLALQERLMKQSYELENEVAAAATAHVRANPLELCEKFVHKFNNATLEEQDKHRAEAERILVHSKRRVGLSSQGEGEHVDLPMAWSELAILAQCKGKLQEDCFEVLCKSLNQAPLHEENIPTLFFLAESSLYWLRTDTVNNSYLRTAEIRLLKLGFLVFTRLYYHFLVGNLVGLDEFKTRLQTYLEGVREHEVLYKSYPSVWFALRFIAHVGHIVTAVKPPRTEEEDDGDNAPHDKMPPILIRPIVYQALHVWRCKDKGVGLKKALLDIIVCAKDLAQEDWINALFAISIFGDAAKANFLVCRSFQDVARGVIVPVADLLTPRTTEMMASTISPKKNAPKTTENTAKSGKREKETRGETFQNIMTGMMADFDSVLGKTPGTQTSGREVPVDLQGKDTINQSDSKSPIQAANVASTSRITPTGASQGSTLSSNPNTPKKEPSDPITMGISTWDWEVAYHYSQVMSDICLNGANASIQKVAMLGKWLGADVTTFRAGVPNFCIESCGLVDLLEYRNPKILPFAQSSEKSSPVDDWSWKIRYGALSGLLYLTHALRNDKLKEGMRSAAWSLIMSLQDSPVTEDRVLEALRVGQVEYPDFNANASRTSLNIWSRVSQGLTEHFLVPFLPPPKSPSSLAQHTASARPTGSRSSNQLNRGMKLSPPPLPSRSQTSPCRKSSPNRVTLKDHLTIPASVDQISADFSKRNELNLQRIIEDQWRKELIREHEEDERKKINDLKMKQKEEEERIAQVGEKRKQKLKGKSTQNLGPYEVP